MMALFIVAPPRLRAAGGGAGRAFPTRIRYTAIACPISGHRLVRQAAAGHRVRDQHRHRLGYMGLWFPAIVTAIAAVVTFLFWPETKDRDIHA